MSGSPEACPFLPPAPELLTADSMRRWRVDRGSGFYVAALTYAQSLWLQKKPAQALLQLNKAWSAGLGEDQRVLTTWEPPYRALVWMLSKTPGDCFVGNPIRHFQHLATRGPAGVRSWRAWACFHLSELSGAGWRDKSQIERERLRIPELEEIEDGLRNLGWAGELEVFNATRRNLERGAGD